MSSPPRRRFLQQSAILAAGALLPPAVRAETVDPPVVETRELAFAHLHTSEQLALAYAIDGEYLPDALLTLDHFLRDHYSGEVGRMDPRLYDVLHNIRRKLATDRTIEVISAYRCPTTNATLRSTRNGGVASRSLHMDGKAIDIRIDNIALADLRDAALSLQAGGVGYYPREQFIHIDTGRVRSWQG